MKVNASKIGIFLAGFGVGAAISAFVTDKIVDKEYRNAADEEITKANHKANEKIKAYKAEIKELQEKISRQKVTINTLADQVRENKGGDISDILKEIDEDDDSEADPGRDIQRSKTECNEKEGPVVQRKYEEYAKRYRSGGLRRHKNADLDDEPDCDPVEEEEAIERRRPRLISEDTYSTTALEYSKEDLTFYLYDRKIVSDDGEYLDNYAGLIGEDWIQRLQRAGDEVFVRNDNLQADYLITAVADYGESNISDSTEEWED